MGKKKEKPIDLKNLEPEEKLKYEVAEELGLLDRVMEHGWRSLTSKETGRIGGLVTKKRRKPRVHCPDRSRTASRNFFTKQHISDTIVQLGSCYG